MIALWLWRLDQPDSGHFTPITGYTSDGDIIRHQVYGGGREVLDADTWSRWSKGQFLAIDKW